MTEEYRPFEVTEVSMMRALAHPVRQQILAELVGRRHARAADLAGALDLPANSVSFHLRTLAKAGLIVEAPERARDRRDRVWKPLSLDGYRVSKNSPEARLVTEPVLRWLRALLVGEADEFLGEPQETVRISNISQVPLTKAEAEELAAEVDELGKRWAVRVRDARDADPGTARPLYQAVFALGPMLRNSRSEAGSPASRPDA
ncbi:helix-turn-helix transcriptional regulator [Microbacterium sp. Marseille-Q6965]|uniref:ArsR/SmtB family transcription factor n=1 Tax=Microbacterium sp. Marseille-Q6965 TaxID=2965072 RepID=UPI0021B7A534|nr:helix-turn-helix domain-containing protein [Microbacterium sp. Marseille-Q6965]